MLLKLDAEGSSFDVSLRWDDLPTYKRVLRTDGSNFGWIAGLFCSSKSTAKSKCAEVGIISDSVPLSWSATSEGANKSCGALLY